MDAMAAAIEVIRQEHRALATVMEVMQRLLAEIAAQHVPPDFTLLSAALYYVADFPERCHHPKEDEHLFKALRRRTTQFNAVLDELQAEHVHSGRMLTQLQCALVRYQGGAAGGLEAFRAAITAYAAMMDEHMRKEDALLERARQTLAAEDWQAIAAAFGANDDPLFGTGRREEFHRLYLRILNLLPRKIRLAMLHPAGPGQQQ
ncbi:MAG: hemerythrin domain-containing protein [Burkholderiales bacterium]